MSNPILLEVHEKYAKLTLNQPERRNAISPAFIQAFEQALKKIPKNTHALVIKANGQDFCAGADLAWMRDAAGLTPEENFQDAYQLAHLLLQLHQCPYPILLQVHGRTFGGGMGLVAIADYVMASTDASFSFSEIKLGLLPAIISPFVRLKISPQVMKRLFFTGQMFSSQVAHKINLVDEVIDEAILEQAIENRLKHWCHTPSELLASIKAITQAAPVQIETLKAMAKHLAHFRCSSFAQKHIQAFLER